MEERKGVIGINKRPTVESKLRKRHQVNSTQDKGSYRAGHEDSGSSVRLRDQWK